MDDRVWFPVNGADGADRAKGPYEHWYYRIDAEGRRQRAEDDIMLTLLDAAFSSNTDIEKMISPPPNRANFRSHQPSRVDVDGNDALIAFERTDYRVLVGAIDIDIPLGHRAFRHGDGTTRVLAHWAMGFHAGGQRYGRVFVQSEINDLLKEYSVDHDLTKPLDADGFNRAIGALDVRDIRGARGLGRRHSHGAHMLDVAGGADPLTEAAFSNAVGLVTVAMPSRWEFGEGGEFLDQHMVNAVHWVAKVERTFNAAREDQPPVPMVSCLAFGRQAGAKQEDTDLLSRFLADLERNRAPDAPPFELVIPTGNDNQSRVVGQYRLDGHSTYRLDWRVKPGDQTDNYLEVWAEKHPEDTTEDDHLAVNLIPPGTPSDATAMTGAPDMFHDIASDRTDRVAARLYRFQAPDGIAERDRAGFLMALGPTEPRGESLGEAPVGPWTVQLTNTSRHPIIVHLSIQTDQSIQVAGQFSGRSYLDDPDYQKFTERGGNLDAVRYDKDSGWVVSEDAWGVRRHGTMNVAASQSLTAVVSGYRASDGKPAGYASAGLGKQARSGRAGPTAAMPVDDTPVLGGTFGAGSNEGSKVAMRGTSFAASKATRLVAQTWVNAPDRTFRRAKTLLTEAAHSFEGTESPYLSQYDPTSPNDEAAFSKLGEGRIPFEVQGAVLRG